jgi:CHAT domain-containing protein
MKKIVLLCFFFIFSITGWIFATNSALNWEVFQNKLLVPEPLLEKYTFSDLQKSRKYQYLLDAIVIGDSLYMDGKPDEACLFYRKGHTLAAGLNLYWLRILFYNRLGFSNFWNENLDTAIEYYTKAYNQVISSKIIEDTLAAFEAISFGIMYLNKLPCSEKNIDCIWNIERLTDSGILNSQRKVKYFELRAAYSLWNNDLSGSWSDLKKAESSINKDKRSFEVWLFLNTFYKALYFRYKIELQTSFEYLQALRIKTKYNPRLKIYYFNICYNLGIVLNYLNEYVSAKKVLEEIQPFANSKHYIHFYEYYLWLGNTYQSLGEISKTLQCYSKAEQILKRKNINDLNTLKLYLFQVIFYNTGIPDPEMELRYLHLAEEILNKFPDEIYYRAYIAYYLSDYYNYNGYYEKTIAYLNPQLKDIDSVLNSEEYFYTKLNSFTGSFYQSMLLKRSSAFYFLSKKNNYDTMLLKSSYEDLKDLVYLSTKIINEIDYEKSKFDDMIFLRYAYDDLINVGYELYRHSGNNFLLNELFHISENSSAILLRSYISDEMAKEKADIPRELIEISTQMKKEIDILQYTLKQQEGKFRRIEDGIIINQVLEKQIKYKKFDKELEEKFPQYARFKNIHRDQSIGQLQKELHQSEAILDYHFSDNAFYLFYIDKNNFKLFYTPITKQFPDSVIAYRNLLANMKYGNFSEQQKKQFMELSFGFYNLMIKPIEKLITNKHLIIVPDRELNLIPFETFITQKEDTTQLLDNFSKLSYLLLKNPISYIYSASQISDKTNFKRSKIRFAGFAPDYKAMNVGVDTYNSSDSLFRVLPGAIDEVLLAKKYYYGRVFLGKDANKENFFSAISKYDIVHLAMHTIIDMNEPMNSELIFSSDLSCKQKQLYAFEVYSHKTNANLVVLSACNTGSGAISRGEGIISIARAFLLAGINNIVITQWSVADRSSAYLMDKFYQYLSEGNPSDVAMQKAKTDLIIKGDPVKAYPYYWAGYVCLGKPAIFQARKNILWYYITGGLVGIFILIIILRKTKILVF